MKTPNTKEDGRFIIALGRALKQTHKESEALFRQYELTMAQFTVLEALYHKGEMTVGMLIEAVLSTSGNMTVVVRNLERQGLISRLPNPGDGRSYLLRLSESGKKLIAELYPLHMALLAKCLAPLSAEEKEAVVRILKKIL